MDQPPGKGWLPWFTDPYISSLTEYPWKHKEIELWRPEWDSPRRTAPNAIPPEMNGMGLYWRPA